MSYLGIVNTAGFKACLPIITEPSAQPITAPSLIAQKALQATDSSLQSTKRNQSHSTKKRGQDLKHKVQQKPILSCNEAALKIQRWFRNKLTCTPTKTLALINKPMKPLKNSRKTTENLWAKLKAFGNSLHDKYYTFTHASSLQHGSLVDMATHLNPLISYPAFSSRWDSTKTMRPQGVAPVLFSNIDEYLQSNLCRDINEKRADDGYPHNAHILSCDGFFDNTQAEESAYYFFTKNNSIFNPNEEFVKAFFQKYIQDPIICQFAATTWRQGISKYNLLKESSLGRVYLIAIKKETLQNTATNYVWRSHAYGRVCNCIDGDESAHEKFIKTLEAHQNNLLIQKEKCPNPQYRILTGNLQRDSTKKIFAFEALSSEQKKPYKKFFWDLAHIVKQCQRLESITNSTPQSELLSILLRIRFDLTTSHPSDNALYQLGLSNILSSKKEIFLHNKNYLIAGPSKSNFNQLLKFINQNLKNNKEFVLTAVKQNGEALLYASEALKNDQNIVLAAVQQNGKALFYASEALKNDQNIVLAAAQQNGEALLYASEDLKNDQTIVLAAIEQNHNGLKYASEALKNNKEFVLKVIRQNPWAFKHISKALKNDQKTVLAAVKQQSGALQYASKALQNDEKIVLVAIEQHPAGLKYASKALQNNKKFVLAAVTKRSETLQYASKALQNNKKFVLAAVTQQSEALQYASENFKNDIDIVLAAVTQRSEALQYASENFKNNKDKILTVVKQNASALQYASNALQNDIDIVLAAVTQRNDTFRYASEALRKDKEFLLAAISQNASVLRRVSYTLQDDFSFVLAAVGRNGLALKYAIEIFRDNKDIVLAAIRQNTQAFKFASNALKTNKQFIATCPSIPEELFEDNDYSDFSIKIFKPIFLNNNCIF